MKHHWRCLYTIERSFMKKSHTYRGFIQVVQQGVVLHMLEQPSSYKLLQWTILPWVTAYNGQGSFRQSSTTLQKKIHISIIFSSIPDFTTVPFLVLPSPFSCFEGFLAVVSCCQNICLGQSNESCRSCLDLFHSGHPMPQTLLLRTLLEENKMPLMSNLHVEPSLGTLRHELR